MFVLFLLIWIIFNGQITLEIVLFGILISALIVQFMCKFMDYDIKGERMNIKLLLLGIKYLFILVWEIIKANLAVIKLIMDSRYELEPAIVKFKTTLSREETRVLLANSITMTPGTITASLEGEEFVVHCLDKSLADGIDSSVFVEQLKRMEEIVEGKKC